MNQPGALAGLMGGEQGMKATPVHHVIENKSFVDPVTGQKKTTQVGSNLREQMTGMRDKFRALSQSPDVPQHYRQQYHHMANQLEVDIGEEDAYHAKEEGALGPLSDESKFAEIQGNRARLKGGSAPTPPVVMAPGSAPKPFIPPR